MKFVVEPNNFEISVGGSLPGTKVSTTESITKTLNVTGNAYFIK
jgi:hypothetical protein